jgi:DNA-binding MltR family transcriptional regulator
MDCKSYHELSPILDRAASVVFVMMKSNELFVDSAFKNLMDRSSLVEDLLRKETDRGCALVAGAALDEVLGGLLTVYLLKDKEIVNALFGTPNAPLSSFSARIWLCRGIGLISKELCHDIDSVRYIRNQAAHFESRKGHGHDFTFDRQDIVDRCRSLRSLPPISGNRYSARFIFELFVGITAGCLGEHAKNWKLVADNLSESAARECMLKGVPTIDLRGHLQKVLDALQARLSAAENH